MFSSDKLTMKPFYLILLILFMVYVSQAQWLNTLDTFGSDYASYDGGVDNSMSTVSSMSDNNVSMKRGPLRKHGILRAILIIAIISVLLYLIFGAY